MKLFSIILLSVVLLIVVALQLVSPVTEVDENAPSRYDVNSLVPVQVEGWTSEEIPLSSSEATSVSALKMLKLDEFVQRKFSRGMDSVTVYIAYWKPGKMDTRLVASHTPDRCWVANGWECKDALYAEVMRVDGLTILPAEYRDFDISGHHEMVFYWLMVNGELYRFGERLNSFPDPFMFARDFFKEMFRGRPEHLFVRISSSIPREKLEHEPIMRIIMESLHETGISSVKDGVVL